VRFDPLPDLKGDTLRVWVRKALDPDAQPHVTVPKLRPYPAEKSEQRFDRWQRNTTGSAGVPTGVC
jgi:hypothetical protein